MVLAEKLADKSFEEESKGASVKIEFELKGLPKMTNSHMKNGGTHWARRKKEADEWKNRVMHELLMRHRDTLRQLPKPLSRAKLVLTRFSSVPPDPDGLVSGFKHIVDGLVNCGVLKDDKLTTIGMPAYRWEKIGRGKGKVSVQVFG